MRSRPPLQCPSGVSAPRSAPYVGRYDVRLRRVDGRLRLCRKRAVLDHETLSDHGALSIIF